jgi:hypothetical protein
LGVAADGAVAGYLQGGDTRDGATVGTIALGPFLLFAGLFVLFGFVPAIGICTTASAGMMGGTGGMAPFGGGFFILFALLAFVVGALVVIGSGALGGVVGAYVTTETDLGD